MDTTYYLFIVIKVILKYNYNAIELQFNLYLSYMFLTFGEALFKTSPDISSSVFYFTEYGFRSEPVKIHRRKLPRLLFIKYQICHRKD